MNTEPALSAAALLSAINAFVVLILAFGLVHLPKQPELSAWGVFVAFLAVVAQFAAALYIRNRMTPLIRPQDEDGEPLVRKSGGPTQAQINAQLKGKLS